MKIQGSGAVPSRAGTRVLWPNMEAPQYFFLYLGLTATRGHQSGHSFLHEVAKQLLVKSTKITVISRRSHTRFLMTTVGVNGGLRVSAADQSVGAGCHRHRKVHYRGRISWERERGARYRRNRRGGWVDKRDGRVLFVGCAGCWRGG